MTDLIRRADALAVVLLGGSPVGMSNRIAALPAVTVGVPCTWPTCGHTAKGQCNPSTNLAALEPVDAPDPAAMLQAKRCAACGSTVTDLDDHLVHDEECGGEPDEPVAAPDAPRCPKCNGRGYIQWHPHWDNGSDPCDQCSGFGKGMKPAPDPAAIREAADVVEREIEQAKQLMPMVVPILRSVHRAILALIPTKGPADDRA